MHLASCNLHLASCLITLPLVETTNQPATCSEIAMPVVRDVNEAAGVAAALVIIL